MYRTPNIIFCVAFLGTTIDGTLLWVWVASYFNPRDLLSSSKDPCTNVYIAYACLKGCGQSNPRWTPCFAKPNIVMPRGTNNAVHVAPSWHPRWLSYDLDTFASSSNFLQLIQPLAGPFLSRVRSKCPARLSSFPVVYIKDMFQNEFIRAHYFRSLGNFVRIWLLLGESQTHPLHSTQSGRFLDNSSSSMLKKGQNSQLEHEFLRGLWNSFIKLHGFVKSRPKFSSLCSWKMLKVHKTLSSL